MSFTKEVQVESIHLSSYTYIMANLEIDFIFFIPNTSKYFIISNIQTYTTTEKEIEKRKKCDYVI